MQVLFVYIFFEPRKCRQKNAFFSGFSAKNASFLLRAPIVIDTLIVFMFTGLPVKYGRVFLVPC